MMTSVRISARAGSASASVVVTTLVSGVAAFLTNSTMVCGKFIARNSSNARPSW
jgi:hypothetical protein